ncbi:MAG: DUF1592 domain-containing protein [Planctomycetota bacterium]
MGDVNLKGVTGDRLAANIDLLGSLVRVLESGEMPPEDSRQLDPPSRELIVQELRSMLRHSIEKRGTFDQAPIRRMNRFQYNNAVIDLFDLRCIVFTLPERMMREHRSYFQPSRGKMPDRVHVGSRPLGKSQMIEKRLAGVTAFPQDRRAEHGFDNRGDHLSMSPLLMESFLELGQSITESPDFHNKNVGVWDSLFAPPGPDVDESTEFRRRLQSFLTRAFRRPADADLLDRYTTFASRQLDSGADFTGAMKTVAAAAIASPRFLYLYDREPNLGDDDFELASRLSFFLWGSLPDQELLDLAAAGKLREPDVLKGQFRRMMRDRKLKRFCDSFPAQWLQLERIVSSVPNRDQFPDFFFSKYRASMHMMLEPLLLFETVVIEDLPITQLIDSDFTYRSAMLERAYSELGNPPPAGARKTGVTVLQFDRVPVKDRRTGGVITNAAIMTMTAGPHQSKPITRGAWVASVIFNDPPEPPPADVPPLAEKPASDEAHLTLRERLSLHRERSDCRGCHEQIDPLGFALENYDAIGRWRSHYENGREVDVAGRLFRKHTFRDIAEFKDAILAEKDRFTIALAGHLLSFALAREFQVADSFPVQKIAEATAADDYRMQTLLEQVVMSEPFRGDQSTSKDH